MSQLEWRRRRAPPAAAPAPPALSFPRFLAQTNAQRGLRTDYREHPASLLAPSICVNLNCHFEGVNWIHWRRLPRAGGGLCCVLLLEKLSKPS